MTNPRTETTGRGSEGSMGDPRNAVAADAATPERAAIDFTQTHAVVVAHGGASYIKVFPRQGYGYYGDEKTIAVNGETNMRKAPGDDGFWTVDGAVSTLQKITPAKRIVTKYTLRPDLAGSSKEDVVSVAQYGQMPEADQGLYVAQHEDIPREAEDIPFIVQSEGGPPTSLPKGVVCADKNSFARFKSFHHLGPVYAPPRYVLYRLAQESQKLMGANPLIEQTHISRRDTPEEILNSTYSGSSWWLKVRPMTINGIEVTPKGLRYVFTIDEKDRSSDYLAIVRGIHGDNLADLEGKIATHVGQLLQPLRNWVQPDACPCCKRKFSSPSKMRATLARAEGRA